MSKIDIGFGIILKYLKTRKHQFNGVRSERCHGLDEGLMYSLLPNENLGIKAT